jgi:hypothetical protein
MSHPQENRNIPLPQDKNAAVVTLDFRGGYPLPRGNSRPRFTIFADGRIRVVDASGETSALETKMSVEELQELLRFVIDDHKFFEFDETIAVREVSEEAKKSGFQFSMADGISTVITIRTAEREHKAQFYALYDNVLAYPDARLLANLAAVEERLSHLKNVVEAGGIERVSAALKIANEHLRTAYPAVPAVTEDDFLYAKHSRSNPETFVFLPGRSKRKPPETTEERIRKMLAPEPELSVEVQYSSGEPPLVTVKNVLP